MSFSRPPYPFSCTTATRSCCSLSASHCTWEYWGCKAPIITKTIIHIHGYHSGCVGPNTKLMVFCLKFLNQWIFHSGLSQTKINNSARGSHSFSTIHKHTDIGLYIFFWRSQYGCKFKNTNCIYIYTYVHTHIGGGGDLTD